MDVQTIPVEVTTSSSDVADEEQFFFTQAGSENEAVKPTLGMKKTIDEKGKKWLANEESSTLKPSIKEFTKIDGNTTSFTMSGIKANARVRVEQDVDLVPKNLKFQIIGQPQDEVLLTTDRQNKHYKANDDRIILKEGLLFRKNYGETGSVENYQTLIPEQLVSEVLWSLHGELESTLELSRQ